MKLSQKQLQSFNKSIISPYWVCANENVNKERKLPSPEIREQLRKLVSHKSGIMKEPLTMRDVKEGLEDGVIKF